LQNELLNASLSSRFWNYLQLLGVMTITWFFEILPYTFHDSYGSYIVKDALKLLTAVVIFAIFALPKNVRVLVFQRYATLNNNAEK